MSEWWTLSGPAHLAFQPEEPGISAPYSVRTCCICFISAISYSTGEDSTFLLIHSQCWKHKAAIQVVMCYSFSSKVTFGTHTCKCCKTDSQGKTFFLLHRANTDIPCSAKTLSAWVVVVCCLPWWKSFHVPWCKILSPPERVACAKNLNKMQGSQTRNSDNDSTLMKLNFRVKHTIAPRIQCLPLNWANTSLYNRVEKEAERHRERG